MSAQEEYEKADTALKTPGTKNYVYKGRTYTLTQLRDDLLPKLKLAAEEESTAQRTAAAASRASGPALAEAQAAVNAASGPLESAQKRFARGEITEAQLKPFQDTFDLASKNLQRLTGKPAATTQPVTPGKPVPFTGDKELGVKVKGVAPLPSGPTVTPTSGGGAGGVAPKGTTAADRKAFVDAELTKRKLADTPENRAMLRKEFATKTAPTAPPVLTPEIEQAFTTKYPTYAWMLTDLDRTKYSDVFQLIAEASNPLKEMDAAEFKRRFEGSSFTQELALKKINRELTGSVGSFSWGSGQLAKFLNKANQYGYTGESLKQAAYQALFEQDSQTKQFRNPNAINEVKASTPFMRLKKIGSDYLSPLSDDRIIETLTGGISEDDVLRITREKAIALYPHLTRQIEAGLTLQDLAYDYKATAAQLLEKTPDQIDMSDYRFNVALKTGDTGKERMMSTSEWANKIRSDESYGWQYTKQANDQATELALGLARAFGRRK